jgi:membrane peptidoglycan carboxypeptidase
VKVLDHTAAFATFPNLGKTVSAHAVIEVRTPGGHLVWSFERDGKKPEQVISKEIAIQMTQMMKKVIEEGTGRLAALDGIPAAGKTGTTNNYRDAWFVGYTGKYVCGVWFGNDDYSPTNRMTGGSVPATTWRHIMTAAHRGAVATNLPGVKDARSAFAMMSPDELNRDAGQTSYPVLSERGARVLRELALLMEQARGGTTALEDKSDLQRELSEIQGSASYAKQESKVDAFGTEAKDSAISEKAAKEPIAKTETPNVKQKREISRTRNIAWGKAKPESAKQHRETKRSKRYTPPANPTNAFSSWSDPGRSPWNWQGQYGRPPLWNWQRRYGQDGQTSYWGRWQ